MLSKNLYSSRLLGVVFALIYVGGTGAGVDSARSFAASAALLDVGLLSRTAAAVPAGALWSVGLFGLTVGLGAFWYGGLRRPEWWKRGWRWVRTQIRGPQRKPPASTSTIDTGLTQVIRRMQETIAEKSGLFAATVHDLKTPLLGIRQLAEIVLEDDTLSADGRHKLELIRASAGEAMAQVDRLLAEEADETERTLGWEPVDVRTLVDEVVDRFQSHAEYKRQTLDCRLPDTACWVTGDELRLREAVSNVVSNALKYSPQGELIAVRVACSEEAVRISVSDNGPGLDARDQARLFSPFQSLSPQPTGNECSTGVGLYITKQVMALHGGDVEVVTAEGEGSTFSLVLPTAPSASPPDVPKKDDRPAPTTIKAETGASSAACFDLQS